VRAGRGKDWGALKKIENIPELRDVETWKKAIREIEERLKELRFLQQMRENVNV
jgi:hypothetical protein